MLSDISFCSKNGILFTADSITEGTKTITMHKREREINTGCTTEQCD